MLLTPDTSDYDRWMDALAALETHDRSCQPCMSSTISWTNLAPTRCTEGERLQHAQAQLWHGWYDACIDRTGERDTRMPSCGYGTAPGMSRSSI